MGEWVQIQLYRENLIKYGLKRQFGGESINGEKCLYAQVKRHFKEKLYHLPTRKLAQKEPRYK